MNSLSEIYSKINECDKCHLHKNRIVPWHFRGNENADIVFIGEAPGATEAKEGYPFIGRSGQLLQEIIDKMGLKEDNYFITNLVKCRPPNNRNPFYDEIVICMPYLLNEIKLIDPKLIVTLGKVPGNWYSNGKEYKINTYYPKKRWIPLYHPAYLLRNRKTKPDFVRALMNITKELNIL